MRAPGRIITSASFVPMVPHGVMFFRPPSFFHDMMKLFFTPALAVGISYLLSAAFRTGPLSSNGRINLRVAGVLAGVMVLLVVLLMTRAWRVN